MSIGICFDDGYSTNYNSAEYKIGDQNGYERGYKQGFDKGYSDGDFFGKIKTIKEIKQFMLETFGGDDGTGNLNKIYEHLDELEKMNDQTRIC